VSFALYKHHSIAPILACGCTCIIKSSEKTPLTALLMAQLVKDAGIPPGVVNILSGYGPDCGGALAKHPDVDKVAFTGSSAVGHEIVKYSAETNLKKVSLQLGGKSPLIICDDADLEQAADATHIGLFLNHGQCCCASSRIFIDSKIHDKFVELCIERAKNIAIGTDEGKFQGPQVDKIQFDKIMDYIESGKKEGATCALGGKRIGTKGYFLEPTIFTNVEDSMTIAKEEIFGPVMQLMKVRVRWF
jgi:aldehyde dehydrogenase (NAD+)